MATYTVMEAQQVRQLPGKPEKNWPAKWVDHLTLKANGSDNLIPVTAFRKLDVPIPTPGSSIEGEIGEPDRFDKERRKFKAGGGFKGGGFRKRDPQESRRIERQHAQGCALQYIAIKAQLGTLPEEPNGKQNFDLSDVWKLADAFDADLDPASRKSDMSEWADDGGLPPA